MAFEENAIFETKTASSNVTALSYTSSDGSTIVYSSGGIPQYYVVMEDTGTNGIGDVKLAGAASKCIGVAQDAPAVTAGQPVRVCVRGVCKAYAGAAIAYGDSVAPNASGQVITAPTATEYVLGRAREAAVEAGDLISIEVAPTSGKVVYP
jgi:hypothetical protein